MEASKIIDINKNLKSIKTRAEEIEKEGEGIVDSPLVYAVRGVNKQLGIGGVPLAVPLAYAEYLNDKRVEKKIDETRELTKFFGTCNTDMLGKLSKETKFSIKELNAIKKISVEGFDLIVEKLDEISESVEKIEKEIEKINLPTITDILEKGSSKNSEFFRSWGP